MGTGMASTSWALQASQAAQFIRPFAGWRTRAGSGPGGKTIVLGEEALAAALDRYRGLASGATPPRVRNAMLKDGAR